MAGLKIKTPSKVHTQSVAIGIDLGTTHSLVAVYHEDKLTVLSDEQGRTLLPSIGTIRNSIGQPEIIRSVKRLIGHTHNILPVQISAQILKVLYQRAKNFLKDTPISGAVITVPAYFDDSQRSATKQAAQLAGIPVLRLINEPTAAALAYGLTEKETGTCLVFDLGGGTFDVSLLEITSSCFEVLATGGDTQLGGDDIDHLIARWFDESDTTEALLLKAQAAKEALTLQNEVTIEHASQSKILNRAILAECVQLLIDRMLKTCQRVLLDGKRNLTQVDQLVLVGGSTKMPLIQAQIEQWFGKPIHKKMNPDEVVAIGAALHANALTDPKSPHNLLLLDVIPLSLGLEMMSGTVEKMIMRNSTVPCSRKETFTTYQDNQTGLSLHVVQGERELVKDCRSLAKINLKGFPPLSAGKAKIEVIFQIDMDGLLTVSATELTSGVSISVNVEPGQGLSQNTINDLIEESILNAEEDMASKALEEIKLSASQLIKIAQTDFENWGQKLLSLSELQQFKVAFEEFVATHTSGQYAEIRAAQKKFEPLMEILAERKLNFSLTSALQGKNVSEILK